jgi:Ala-tRNA(Pro) deacylase
LISILDNLEINYQIFDHAPIFTVAEGEHLKANIPGTHCRNLFVRDKKEKMFLVVAANDTAVDLKKLPDLLGCGRLSFGSAERLWQHLGIYPGAVCPFALINDKDHQVSVVLDAYMMAQEIVNYHPLDNAKTISLKPADLLKFLEFTGHKPQILDLSLAAPDAAA